MARFNEAKKIIEDMKKSEKAISEMVDTMGIYAINHFKQSFVDGGFTDEGFEPWKRRKSGRDRKKGKSENASGGTVSLKVGRQVLTKTGRLRRSLVSKKLGRYQIRISSNVPYAKIHNEGARTGSVNVKPGVRFRHRGDTITEGTGQFSIKTRKETKRTIKLKAKEHVSGYSRRLRMPKRQFVGYSERLNRKIITKLDSKIRAIFK